MWADQENLNKDLGITISILKYLLKGWDLEWKVQEKGASSIREVSRLKGELVIGFF